MLAPKNWNSGTLLEPVAIGLQCWANENSGYPPFWSLYSPNGHQIRPALQPNSDRFQQGSRPVPVFRDVHFPVTSPLPKRLKPNRFAVGNNRENDDDKLELGVRYFDTNPHQDAHT